MKAVEGHKIWQVNQCDWIWGTRFADALQGYLNTTGMPLSEVFDDVDGEIDSGSLELSDEDLDRLTFTHEVKNRLVKCPFRVELQRRIEDDEDTGFFASTEY